MSKSIAWFIFVSATTIWLVATITSPSLLSDKNDFLKNFVNHEFLNLLGVIVAITLASAANIHLELNKIEDAAKEEFLTRTRLAVKKSSMWLIALFAFGFILVLTKPLFVNGDTAESIVNGLAALIVLFNILVLTDLTGMVFRIKPMFRIMSQKEDDE